MNVIIGFSFRSSWSESRCGCFWFFLDYLD